MITYLLLANVYLVVFYTFYHLFLRKETFFRVNRVYLLGGILLSFTLPMTNIPQVEKYAGPRTGQVVGQVTERLAHNMNAWRTTNVPQQFLLGTASNTVKLEDRLVDPSTGTRLQTSESSYLSAEHHAFWDRPWGLVQWYFLGCIVTLALFFIRLMRTILTLRNRRHVQGAFSFFYLICVSEDIAGYEDVLLHENVHAREWHSLDVLLIQIVRIFNWFNPFVYGYERALKLQHEYHADSLASGENRTEYAELLLATAMQTSPANLNNQFINPSLLKLRIMMVLKNKTPKSSFVKFAFILPMIFGMVVIASASNQAKRNNLASITKIAVDTTQSNSTTYEFRTVEITPVFPGTEGETTASGMDRFRKWMTNNVVIPQEAIDSGFSGTVQISFIIEKDGKLTNIEVKTDDQKDYGFTESVTSLLEKSPKWVPGIQSGQSVRVGYTVPLKVKLTTLR